MGNAHRILVGNRQGNMHLSKGLGIDGKIMDLR
jgi:hypothetical protein